MQLTAEEKLILLVSRLDPSEKTICEISNAIENIKNRFNFDKLYNLAIKNGVVQLVYQYLKHIDGVPKDLLSKLRSAYFHTAADNLRKIHELLKILALLKKNRIPVIPLKGALASELIFEKIGIYHGVDIDLLVHPIHLKKVKRLLIETGYLYSGQTEQDMLSSHYHLAFGNGKFTLEIHWNLVKRYFDIPPDFWWKDTQIVHYNGQEIICLSAEKYLMALIFRLFSHMFYPLKFFVIVSALCHKYKNDLNWDLFMDYVEKYRMKRLSIFILKLLDEFFDTPLPSHLTNKKILGNKTIKKEVLNQLLRKKRASYFGKLVYLFLLDSPVQIIRLLFWRLWPTKSELRLRYHLPEMSKRVYLYYLLNPLLLPYLILKRRSNW